MRIIVNLFVLAILFIISSRVSLFYQRHLLLSAAAISPLFHLMLIARKCGHLSGAIDTFLGVDIGLVNLVTWLCVGHRQFH
jgi:hypothetical protein